MSKQPRRAIFPGSFDPLTNGHVDIIKRGLVLFDEVYIAIGTNTTKTPMFSIGQRKAMLNETFSKEDKIRVVPFDGLTVGLCRELKAPFILRGIRNGMDYHYEHSIAMMNKELYADVETVFLLSSPPVAAISSTIVREILHNNEDAAPFVPLAVSEYLKH